METLIKRTVAKSLAKTNYRHLTERNSHYYEFSLKKTLTRSPYNVLYKGSWLCNEPYPLCMFEKGKLLPALTSTGEVTSRSNCMTIIIIHYGICIENPLIIWRLIRLYNQWRVIVLHNIFRIDWCLSKSIYEDKSLTKVVNTCVAFVSFQTLITSVCGKDLRLENISFE